MSTLALTSLTEEQRAQAQERFVLLQSHLEDGVPLTNIADNSGCSLRTLRSWTARYRIHGLAGLARQTRADRGQVRMPEQLRQFIEGLSLKRPRPSAASVHRKVKRLAADNGWKAPSYRGVVRIIEQLDPALVTLAQEGERAYSEAFDLVHRREADGPNHIWQADHTPLDIWVLDEHGQPCRPWLTVIIDDYSRAVAGWRLSTMDPSAFQTALTLRQAIWRKEDGRWHVCGIPSIFYTDHGSDFTSRHLEQVSADLKFQAIFSNVGEPRGRGRIERFFRTVNQLFLETQPGYTPAGRAPQKAVLSLAELERRMTNFLLDDYHQRIHSETGCAPQQRWEEGAFLPHLPESLEQLDLLLLTVARPRCVQRDGIHFQTLRYVDTTLAAYVGESVIIRYDPRDLTEIRVFHQDRFLCRATCSELAGEAAVSLKEIVEARKARRHELRDRLKSRSQVVDLLLHAHAVEVAATPLSQPETLPKVPRLKRYINDD